MGCDPVNRLEQLRRTRSHWQSATGYRGARLPLRRDVSVTQRSPWSRWMWSLIASIAVIDAIWLIFGRVWVDLVSWLVIGAIGIAVALGLALSRRLKPGTMAHTILIGATMLLPAWPALRVLNHLTMSLALPLADEWLSQLDHTIGFDWLAYMHWLDKQPRLMRLMRVAYGSLTDYSIVLFVVLAVSRQSAERCSEFIKLFLVSAVTCMVVGACFPAIAASAYYNVPQGTFAVISGHPGAYHLEALIELRTAPHPSLNIFDLPGLVTFPSFHTAMGVIAIYCARYNLVLLLASTSINVVMIGSTPLFGSHYGIDVIGGVVVASMAIAAIRYEMRQVWDTAALEGNAAATRGAHPAMA